jgi:hypothetical protein
MRFSSVANATLPLTQFKSLSSNPTMAIATDFARCDEIC